MNIEGNNTSRFDQELNTYDNVDFRQVHVLDPIVDPDQLATKLYVDTHGGGGGGGGDMNYVGTTPATNYIYKASSSDGKSATKSSITDNGSTVSILADCIANKLSKTGGLPTQFLKADGTVDTSTYITNPTYNLGVSTLNNALTILPMTSNILPAGYIATSDFAGTSNFQAFDFNPSTYYASYPNYSPITGGYTGYIETQLLPYGTLFGDYLQIEYPSPINVTGYTIASSVLLSQVPSTFTLLTSTDNVNWTTQGSQVGVQWVLGVPKTYTLTPVTSKYFRLSVGLVGNTGTSTRTNFVINELTMLQNATTNSITVPTLISNKTTFTDNNELISKQFADTKYLPIGTPGIVSGYAFNPVWRATATITSSTKSYYFVVQLNQATLISGFSVYLDSGSDAFRMGIFRGKVSAGTVPMTLCGQSAGGTLPTTDIYARVPITAVSGQNLTFANGEYMTIAFHSQGSTNVFLTGQTTTGTWVELGYNSSSNYAAAGFPATLTSTSVLGGIPNRPCFELY